MFLLLTASIIVVLYGMEFISKRILKRQFNISLTERHYPYDRTVSAFAGTKLPPNYSFPAVQPITPLNNLQYNQTSVVTDSNGFICYHPIALVKPANTIRIVIMGGSMSQGFVQNHSIVTDRTYPSGLYSYRASISGLLDSLLSLKFPQYHFEVFCAAVCEYKICQSSLDYQTRIRPFNADVAIMIAGANEDSGTEASIFKQVEDEQMKKILDYQNELERWNWSNTAYLINLYSQRWHQTDEAHPELLTHKVSPPADKDSLLSFFHSWIPALERAALQHKQVIATYQQILKMDGIYSVFVMQPTLQRKSNQKQLSLLETKLLSEVGGIDTVQILLNMLHLNRGDFYNRKDTSHVMQLGMFNYDFNEWLSYITDSIVKSNHNGVFIDIHHDPAYLALKPSDEFFVDYCHLTPSGNMFMAQRLVKEMEIYMHSKTATDQ